MLFEIQSNPIRANASLFEHYASPQSFPSKSTSISHTAASPKPKSVVDAIAASTSLKYERKRVKHDSRGCNKTQNRKQGNGKQMPRTPFAVQEASQCAVRRYQVMRAVSS